jgi:hypothetical protein
MVSDIIKAVVHRLNRTRGTPPEVGDRDYIAPGHSGYVAPLGYVLPIPFFVGEMYINQNDAPPRLVFVPTFDRFDAPMRIGEKRRALKTRVAGLECAVWGPIIPPDPADPLLDFAGTEELVRELVVALDQELRARFGEGEALELTSSEWMTPGQITSLGMVCVIRFALKVPVLVEAPLTGTATTVTTTTSIVTG